MALDGFPFIHATNNVTSENRTLWQTTTSDFVFTYWAARNYTDFRITSIITNFVGQVNWFPPEEAVSAGTLKTRTKTVYDQRIMYTITGTDNPANVWNMTNETFLFSWPFTTDSQRYCDNLQKVFNITNRIFMIDFLFIPFDTSSPSPTSSPSIGGSSGGDDGVVSKEEGLGGGLIAAICVACVVFVTLVLAFGLWYWRRRRKGYIKQGDYASEPGAMVIVEEPPGFRPLDSDYSEPATNDDPVASDSRIPETEVTERTEGNDQRHDKQGSL